MTATLNHKSCSINACQWAAGAKAPRGHTHRTTDQAASRLLCCSLKHRAERNAF